MTSSLEANQAWRKAKSALLFLLCGLCAFLVLLPLVLLLVHIIQLGGSSLNWHFFTRLPTAMGEAGGGMANAIVGSFLLVGLATIIGVPIGVLGGIYLAEYGAGRMNFAVRFGADILNGTPSIVWGIMVYALVVIPMKGASAYAGGLALGFMMIPLVIRTTEQMLLTVPLSQREAALALGIPPWKMILHVALKSARKGILTGILLAGARVAGETAPLLFTTPGNHFWSRSLAEPTASLPVQIYVNAIGPYDEWHRQAWAGALVLLCIALVVNIGARWLSSPKTPHLLR
jgi:phosphate transport system permease protein